MNTAQDQQSREAYEDGKWYWVEHEGWHGEPPTIAPAFYKANCDSWYSYVFSGISTPYLKVLGPCELQAARALPAGIEPAASVNTMEVMGGREVSLISLRQPLPACTKLYTAAQVLAMDHLPVFESDAIAVNLMRMAGLDKHKARECEKIVRFMLDAAQHRKASQEFQPK